MPLTDLGGYGGPLAVRALIRVRAPPICAPCWSSGWLVPNAEGLLCRSGSANAEPERHNSPSAFGTSQPDDQQGAQIGGARTRISARTATEVEGLGSGTVLIMNGAP